MAIGTMAILAFLLTPLLAGGEAPEPAETGKRLTPSAYLAESGRISVVVDAFAASLHPGDDIIPISVAVALDGNGKGMTLTPSSFTLAGPDGLPVPPVEFARLRETYGKFSFDREAIRQHPPATLQRFSRMHRVESAFFPALGADEGVRADRIHLAAYTWFRTLLYFPRPEHRPEEALTLRLVPDAPEDAVEVRFRIPETVER
jgi:hypothetical protein